MSWPSSGTRPICLVPLLLLAACEDSAVAPDTAQIAGTKDASQAVAGPPLAIANFEYEGLCEASAAAALDDAHFAVASDESEFLAIYKRGQAQPLAMIKREGITDLEGATRIGEQVLWTTSHSLNKDGADKEKRKVLFSTRVTPGPGLEDTGVQATDLRQRIAAKLGVEEGELQSWLNIEGLASDEHGDLLLGLRKVPATAEGKEPETKAYVVRVANPLTASEVASLPAQGGARSSGGVWRLDLGGRGIRSLERVAGGPQPYLVLAGPYTDGTGEFSLFWWDGVSEQVTPGPHVDFGEMTPEAIIDWGNGEVQVLGDNEGSGTAGCSDDGDASLRRWFPSITFSVQHSR